MKERPRKKPPTTADAPLRAVEGWEGFYAVAADGRVWSMSRTVTVGGHPRRIGGYWMTPTIDSKGYPMVCLRRPGTRKLVRVHRVVATAWLSPAGPGQHEVNHKDRDKTNAASTNLEWCTPSENQFHGWIGRDATPKHRTAAARAGTSKRKLSDEQAKAIRTRMAAGETKAAIARDCRVSESTIRAIGRGDRYINPQQQSA